MNLLSTGLSRLLRRGDIRLHMSAETILVVTYVPPMILRGDVLRYRLFLSILPEY